MSFEWPLALVALLAVPAAVAAYVFWDGRRAREAARFASPALYPNLVPAQPGRRRHVPAALLTLALVALLIGVARPRAAISAPRDEATIVLAIDTSFSMAARDVQPTRLAAVQAAARTFLDEVPDRFRVGIVAFATRAYVASAATDDRDATRAALAALRLGQGTAIGDAITLALRVVRSVPAEAADEGGDSPPPAAILLLSDGAQTRGRASPADAALRAGAERVPVFTVALGTAGGFVERPAAGGYTERITVPPDPRTLQRVAATSGGEFFSALDAARLSAVYEDLGSRLGHRKEEREVSAAFAGAAALLLLAGGALSTLWFRRLP